MARCATRAQTLELGPDRVDLCNLVHDDTDELDYFFEAADGTVESLAGWTAWTVTLRPKKQVDPPVAVPANVIADIVEFTITPAHKTALGTTTGWWELAAVDPSGNPQILVNGTISISRNVGAP